MGRTLQPLVACIGRPLTVYSAFCPGALPPPISLQPR